MEFFPVHVTRSKELCKTFFFIECVAGVIQTIQVGQYSPCPLVLPELVGSNMEIGLMSSIQKGGKPVLSFLVNLHHFAFTYHVKLIV